MRPRRPASSAGSSWPPNPRLTLAEVRVAIGYYLAHPAEVDGQVAAADATEEAALEAWKRRQRLLA